MGEMLSLKMLVAIDPHILPSNRVHGTSRLWQVADHVPAPGFSYRGHYWEDYLRPGSIYGRIFMVNVCEKIPYMDLMGIKVYSILRIRCHFWVADFQGMIALSWCPAQPGTSGFPPSRKNVVNGRHTICRAFNIRKPRVQRFLGGGFVYKQNTLKAGHWSMLPVMRTWEKINVYSSLQVSTFSSSSVLFYLETTPKGCNHSESRISPEHVWPIHFPPKVPNITGSIKRGVANKKAE